MNVLIKAEIRIDTGTSNPKYFSALIVNEKIDQ